MFLLNRPVHPFSPATSSILPFTDSSIDFSVSDYPPTSLLNPNATTFTPVLTLRDLEHTGNSIDIVNHLSTHDASVQVAQMADINDTKRSNRFHFSALNPEAATFTLDIVSSTIQSKRSNTVTFNPLATIFVPKSTQGGIIISQMNKLDYGNQNNDTITADSACSPDESSVEGAETHKSDQPSAGQTEGEDDATDDEDVNEGYYSDNEPDFHHLNWLRDTVDFKSYTSPSTSLAITMMPPKVYSWNDEICLRIFTIIRCAMVWIDPVLFYGSTKILSEFKSTALQEAVTGACVKYYYNAGWWGQDSYHEDEDRPYTDQCNIHLYNTEDTICDGWYANHSFPTNDDYWRAAKASSYEFEKVREIVLRERRQNGVGKSKLSTCMTSCDDEELDETIGLSIQPDIAKYEHDFNSEEAKPGNNDECLEPVKTIESVKPFDISSISTPNNPIFVKLPYDLAPENFNWADEVDTEEETETEDDCDRIDASPIPFRLGRSLTRTVSFRHSNSTSFGSLKDASQSEEQDSGNDSTHSTDSTISCPETSPVMRPEAPTPRRMSRGSVTFPEELATTTHNVQHKQTSQRLSVIAEEDEDVSSDSGTLFSLSGSEVPGPIYDESMAYSMEATEIELSAAPTSLLVTPIKQEFGTATSLPLPMAIDGSLKTSSSSLLDIRNPPGPRNNDTFTFSPGAVQSMAATKSLSGMPPTSIPECGIEEIFEPPAAFEPQVLEISPSFRNHSLAQVNSSFSSDIRTRRHLRHLLWSAMQNKLHRPQSSAVEDLQAGEQNTKAPAKKREALLKTITKFFEKEMNVLH